MSRRQLREAAAALIAAVTVDGLGFVAVHDAPRRTLDGVSPVATVESRRTRAGEYARGGGPGELAHTLAATIFVSAPPGGEAAAEDQLDTLSRAVVLALGAAGYRDIETDTSPFGAPIVSFDGAPYRAERISFTQEEYP